jgi:hypothetical protein
MPTPFGNSLSTDEIALKFLRLILPAEGHYVAAIKRKNGNFKPTEFFLTIEDLWAAIKSADRDGYEVYHVCASFKDPRNDPSGTPSGQKQFGRSQRNALGAKSFWLDPDAGPEKAYRDRDAALDALAEFCRAANLPPPIVVSSGSVFTSIGRCGKCSTRRHGHTTPAGSRIFASNTDLKPTPRAQSTFIVCFALPERITANTAPHATSSAIPNFWKIEPFPIEQFEIFAAHAGDPRPAKNANLFPFAFVIVPNHVSQRSGRRRIADGMAQVSAYPPASGRPIAEQCGQVRALRDKKGCLPEPSWYAALGVLAFCDDGDELAHEWSSGL